MIYKKKDTCTWLEFEQLQPFNNLFHAIFLKDSSYFSPSLTPIHLNQTHGSMIHEIKEPLQEKLDGDALATKIPSLGLVIRHADCQAALFYDPKNKAIAAAHSGWRGSCANIYGKTVHFMTERFGSTPKDLLVCIGPSLGPESAEFINYKQELPLSFLPYQIRPAYFDFWQISHDQLTHAGVLKKNIEIAYLDTYQDSTRFHSYRRDHTKERHQTVLALI